MTEYRTPAAQLKAALSRVGDDAYVAVKEGGASLLIQVEGGAWFQMGEVEVPMGMAASESYSSDRWVWDEATRSIRRRG